MITVVSSTAAIVNPVSLTEALEHCRITNHDDDGYVESLITRATRWVEKESRRRLIVTALKYTRDAFPDGCSDEAIELPLPPYKSFTSLKYYNSSGVLTTLASTSSSTAIQIDTYSEPARIKPVFGTVWPATRDMMNAVEVNYTAGYSTSSTGVPDTYRHAILLLVGYWYENRESASGASGGTDVIPLPFTIDSLLGAEVYNRVYERD